MARMIEIVSYNPAWRRQYREEAFAIADVLGGEVVSIHHIGSTSVPGLVAKPIIDILIEARDISRIDKYNEKIAAIGYEPKGEFGIPGRRYFQKLHGEIHLFHIHIFQSNDPQLMRHLNFRDFMRAHPDDALSYAVLKRELAVKFRDDIDGYTESKTAFISVIDEKALIWKERYRRD